MLGRPRDTDGIPARFIRFWAAIGAGSHPPRTARRLAVINILSLMVALMTIPYIVLYGVHDWRGLWIPIVTLSPQIVLYAVTPLWNRAGPYASAIYLSLVWVVFAFLYTWYFGRESGLHYYFLPGAAASMLVCGADKLRHSALIALTSLAGFVVAERVFVGPAPFIHVTPGFTNLMFALSAPFAFLLVFVTVLHAFLEAGRAEDALKREHQRSEALLLGILPRRVAETLKAAPDRAVAEALPAATILIADVVSFSTRSAGLPPAGLLDFLETLFGRFDRLAAAHRFETIKTMGDAYMAAGGLYEGGDAADAPRHAAEALALAAAMHAAVRDLQLAGMPVRLRIGIHTGPVMAGVIGSGRIAYDLWGETVNLAARMEETAPEGRTQVTRAVFEASGGGGLKARGPTPLRGYGELDTWLSIPSA